MPEQSNIAQLNHLEVRTQTGTSPEIVSMLEQTIFGTKGKVRYRQKHIARGMATQKNLEFIQIQKRERVLGTTGVVTRDTLFAGEPMKSLYIRYLSILPAFQNKETPNPAGINGKTGSLKTRIGTHITDHFEQPVLEANHRAAFYAFVESENFNSKQLCISLGFHPVRKISTLLFSRFFPKKNPQVSLVEENDSDFIRESLSRFYSSHSFYFEDRLFEEGTYFVLKENGNIVAGLRARPVNWEIIEIPGFNGFLMQKVLPYLPLTRRLFNPKNMNFIAFDYLWHAPGKEDHIPKLLEHACTESGIYMGMFWGDVEDKLTRFLAGLGELGLLHKIQGEVHAEVMMRFINFSEADEEKLKNTPVYISSMDMT